MSEPVKKPGKIVTDGEILAMAAVQEILDDLDGAAAFRVLSWAAKRWADRPDFLADYQREAAATPA